MTFLTLLRPQGGGSVLTFPGARGVAVAVGAAVLSFAIAGAPDVMVADARVRMALDAAATVGMALDAEARVRAALGLDARVRPAGEG